MRSSSNVFDKQSRDGRIKVLKSSKSKNPKPTSGHLEIRNLNQPLDTKKVKATSTHRKCPEVVLDVVATRLDEAKQENKITKTTSGHMKIKVVSNGFTHIQECHLIEPPPKFGPGFQKSAGCYHLQMVWINNQDGRISVVVSSKRKSSKPTSGHLKIRNLNQPLDTNKKSRRHRHTESVQRLF